MAEGQETSPERRGVRPPAPHVGGPLGSSGAAPEETSPAADTGAVAEPADGGMPPSGAAGPLAESDKSDSIEGSASAGSAVDAGGTKTSDTSTGATDGAQTEPEQVTGPASEHTSQPQPTADAGTKAETEAEKAGSSQPVPTPEASAEPQTAPPAEVAAGPEKNAEAPAGSGKNAGSAGNAEAAAGSAGNAEAAGSAGNAEAAAGGEGKAEAKAEPGQSVTTGAASPPDPAAGAETKIQAAPAGPATRVLRRANPIRVAKSTARNTSAWARRPSGRFILPAVIAAVLLGAAGTAGVYLVPQALRALPSPSATSGFGQDAGSGPAGSGLPSLGGPPAYPGSSDPVAGGTPPGIPPVDGGVRPADVLASWAQETGTRAGIPVVAVQAYGYAELVVGKTTPSCHLNWTTIAALAKVESSHGSANGAVLNVDGSVAPPIRGLPLDGKGGRPEIRDTDQGALDGDNQFDRAVGPLQFIPQTWTAVAVGNGVDADNNGVSDPNDIDDASLAAAKLLCQGGRDLARPDSWWDAILTYNAVRPYARNVFDAANDYGQRSRV